MKTNTTKKVTNVTSETKSTKPVAKSTKPVETKSTTKPVAKPVATKTANTEKTNKLYSFNEVMNLFSEYNIGSKSNTNGYRILNGGSSLHVLKYTFRLYATNTDFDAIERAKLNDVKCMKNDNANDKKRPNTVTITSNQSLIEVIKLLAMHKSNAPC